MEEALQLFAASREAGLEWFGVAAAAVVLGIRAFRSPAVQAVIPAFAQWSRLKSWVRLSIVFGASLLASWVTALLTGMAPAAALLFSLPTALAAAGGHKVTKAVGGAHTRSQLSKDLGYKPGGARKAASLVIPMDVAALARAETLQKLKRK